MKIAIVSDSHSNSLVVRRALEIIQSQQVGVILHCGDIDEPATVKLFPPYTHFVFGNSDHDRDGIADEIDRIGGTLHGDWGSLELDGRSIAFTHGDNSPLVRELLASDGFDLFFHGHTHQRRDEQQGRTRIINPGALFRAREKTVAVLDLPTLTMESIVVAPV